MSRTTVRYKHLEELKQAVREACLREWSERSELPWSEDFADDFGDPELSPGEQEAKKIADDLAHSVRRALAFYEKPIDRPLGFRGTTLHNFVAAQLAPLLTAQRTSDRREDGQYGPLEPVPLHVLDEAAKEPVGWEIARRGRIVSLLTDRLKYWKRFGLRDEATTGSTLTRTMAVFSLLLGEFPSGAIRSAIDKGVAGVSIAEVIEAECRAMTTARARLNSPG